MTQEKAVNYSLKELLEAGVHFGHQRQRWNPKMKKYIYGVKNGIHILDLTQTYVLLNEALVAIRDTVAKGGRILFVGTKKQCQLPIAESAEKCAQYYVNNRWLGGMMTNWNTVSGSIRSLKGLDDKIANPIGLTKKEVLSLSRQRDRINRDLGGIREMGGLPSLLFVIDINREHIAIAEAKKLGIPVVAIADTNTDPDLVDYVIPGNDDAIRSVELYCDLVSRAVLEGIIKQQSNMGYDAGSEENPNIDADLANVEASAVEASVEASAVEASVEASAVEANVEASAVEAPK
ncbi:MAG: small subunit ribosomal protein S2 [Alphaproteobacteria bacterium]|jgi:small subunit ribosomal protein S2